VFELLKFFTETGVVKASLDSRLSQGNWWLCQMESPLVFSYLLLLYIFTL